MLVGLVHGESWPLRLQIEINEACRTRLSHGLMESVHCACLVHVNFMVVLGLLSALYIAVLLQGPESFAYTCDVFLVSDREIIILLPHFLQHLRAAVWDHFVYHVFFRMLAKNEQAIIRQS